MGVKNLRAMFEKGEFPVAEETNTTTSDVANGATQEQFQDAINTGLFGDFTESLSVAPHSTELVTKLPHTTTDARSTELSSDHCSSIADVPVSKRACPSAKPHIAAKPASLTSKPHQRSDDVLSGMKRAAVPPKPPVRAHISSEQASADSLQAHITNKEAAIPLAAQGNPFDTNESLHARVDALHMTEDSNRSLAYQPRVRKAPPPPTRSKGGVAEPHSAAEATEPLSRHEFDHALKIPPPRPVRPAAVPPATPARVAPSSTSQLPSDAPQRYVDCFKALCIDTPSGPIVRSGTVEAVWMRSHLPRSQLASVWRVVASDECVGLTQSQFTHGLRLIDMQLRSEQLRKSQISTVPAPRLPQRPQA